MCFIVKVWPVSCFDPSDCAHKKVTLGRIVSVLLLCVLLVFVSLLSLDHITVIIPIPKDIILRNDSISILFCSEDFTSGRESHYAHKIVFLVRCY